MESDPAFYAAERERARKHAANTRARRRGDIKDAPYVLNIRPDRRAGSRAPCGVSGAALAVPDMSRQTSACTGIRAKAGV